MFDFSRAAIRDRLVALACRCDIVEEPAAHVANDAKRLVEDEETGEQSYRYIRTGPDHFSLAFTYDCIAALRDTGPVYIPPPETEPFWDPILNARC